MGWPLSPIFISFFVIACSGSDDHKPADKPLPVRADKSQTETRPPAPEIDSSTDTVNIDTDSDTVAALKTSTSPLPPGKPMLLDFTRDHCMPCVIMKPWVDELREKYSKQVGVMEINIDRPPNKPLGMFFKVHSIPTQVYVDKRGAEVKRNVGLATLPQMEKTMKLYGFFEGATPKTQKKGQKKKKKPGDK